MLDVLTYQFDLLSKPVDPKNEFANLCYLNLLSTKIFRKKIVESPRAKVKSCKIFKVKRLLSVAFFYFSVIGVYKKEQIQYCQLF